MMTCITEGSSHIMLTVCYVLQVRNDDLYHRGEFSHHADCVLLCFPGIVCANVTCDGAPEVACTPDSQPLPALITQGGCCSQPQG